MSPVRMLVRPLPMTIVAMGALAALKVASLAGMATQAGSAVVASAHAASSTATSPPSQPPLPTPAQAPAPPAEPPVGEAERALLLELRARRATLDAREQALGSREAIIGAAERRLGARVDELAALQARLEQLETARRERDDANWRGLVKTYEVMRPRDAAAILNEMEMPVLLQVLDRMKEAKAAAILAAMLPDRARLATSELAQMRTRANTPS